MRIVFAEWEEKDAFKAEINPDKKPYTIVMPPPNITGYYTWGHALDQTLQDVLTRWKRAKKQKSWYGYSIDHAIQLTKVKVVEKLREDEGKGEGRYRKKNFETCLGLEKNLEK